MDKSSRKRRRFLKTTGSFAVASTVAGCLGGSGGNGATTKSKNLKTFQNKAGQTVGATFEAVKQLARNEEEAIVYATIDRSAFNKWVQAFNKQYPYAEINNVTGGSEKLISRWTTEYETNNVKANIFISTSNIKRTWQNGQTMKLKSDYMPSFGDAPDKFKSDQNLWIAVRQVLGGFFYNTTQVSESDAGSWMDVVTNSEWQGQKIGWDPTPNRFLISWLFENVGTEFFKALHDMKPRWVDSHTQLARLCGAGEFPVAFTYIHKMGRFGKKLPLNYFKFDPMPSVVSPAVISNKAPQPNTALLFLNWLTSKEGQQLMGKTQYIPWHPKAEYTAYEGVYPSSEYDVDVISPAINIERSMKKWDKYLGDLLAPGDTN